MKSRDVLRVARRCVVRRPRGGDPRGRFLARNLRRQGLDLLPGRTDSFGPRSRLSTCSKDNYSALDPKTPFNRRKVRRGAHCPRT
jgi:hypothetical protein